MYVLHEHFGVCTNMLLVMTSYVAYKIIQNDIFSTESPYANLGFDFPITN